MDKAVNEIYFYYFEKKERIIFNCLLMYFCAKDLCIFRGKIKHWKERKRLKN